MSSLENMAFVNGLRERCEHLSLFVMERGASELPVPQTAAYGKSFKAARAFRARKTFALCGFTGHFRMAEDPKAEGAF